MSNRKRGKKLNSSFLSIRDFENGVEGKVGELTQLLDESGSPKLGKYDQELWFVQLIDLDSGEVKTYWADAGLRGSFKMAKIKPGMDVAIVHTGTKEIDAGTVQTYDLFHLV